MAPYFRVGFQFLELPAAEFHLRADIEFEQKNILVVSIKLAPYLEASLPPYRWSREACWNMSGTILQIASLTI